MKLSFASQLKVGLDIGAHSVYVSLVSGTGNNKIVERLLKIPRSELPREDNQLLANEIFRRMLEAGFPTRNVILNLSAQLSILRYIMVPPAPPWRINLLVKYEVEDIEKRMGSKLCSGWRKQKVGGDGPESPLLLVLGREPEINDLLVNLRRAGLGIVSIVPACEGLLWAWSHFIEPVPGQGVEAIVEIGEKSTQIVITMAGDLLYARQAFFGGQHFNDALSERVEGAPEKIEQLKLQSTGLDSDSSKRDFSETLRRPASQVINLIKGAFSWANSQVKTGKIKLDRVVLSGGGAQLRGLDRYLAKSLDIPVVRAGVSGGMSPEARAVLSRGIEGFLPSIGISAVDLKQEDVLEVLPQKEKVRRKFWNETVFLYGAAVFIALFLLFQFVAAMTQSWNRSSYLQKLNAQVQELDKGFKNIKETQQKQKSIKSRLAALDMQVQAVVFYGRINYFLGNKLPDEIYLLSIKQWPMNEQNPNPVVEIEGLADNKNLKAVDLIKELDTSLSSQAFIHDVHLRAESMNIEKDKNAIRFVMKITGGENSIGKGESNG